MSNIAISNSAQQAQSTAFKQDNQNDYPSKSSHAYIPPHQRRFTDDKSQSSLASAVPLSARRAKHATSILYLFRGMQGSGKTYQTSQFPNKDATSIISANREAAEIMAKEQNITVTADNMKTLSDQYYQNNGGIIGTDHPRSRQKATHLIHLKAQKQMKQLFEEMNDGATFIVDNTNIRVHEMAGYLKIALMNGISVENVKILRINPFNNPKFVTALNEEMINENVMLSSHSRELPDLTFRSPDSRDKHLTINDPQILCMICRAFNKVLEKPLELEYLKYRLKSYLDNYYIDINSIRQEIKEQSSREHEQYQRDNSLKQGNSNTIRSQKSRDFGSQNGYSQGRGANSATWKRGDTISSESKIPKYSASQNIPYQPQQNPRSFSSQNRDQHQQNSASLNWRK